MPGVSIGGPNNLYITPEKSLYDGETRVFSSRGEVASFFDDLFGLLDFEKYEEELESDAGALVTKRDSSCVSERTRYSLAFIEGIFENDCGACGKKKGSDGAIAIGPNTWTHKECARAISTEIINCYSLPFAEINNPEDSPICYPINKKPHVYVRKVTKAGPHLLLGRTSTLMRARLQCDDVYIRSPGMGFLPAGVKRSINKIFSLPQGNQSSIGDERPPFYIYETNSLRDSIKERTVAKQVMEATDRILCSVCTAPYQGKQPVLAFSSIPDVPSSWYVEHGKDLFCEDLPRYVWCHESCAERLANALEKSLGHGLVVGEVL